MPTRNIVEIAQLVVQTMLGVYYICVKKMYKSSYFILLLYYMLYYDLYVYFIVLVKLLYFSLVFFVQYFNYKQTKPDKLSIRGFLKNLGSRNNTYETTDGSDNNNSSSSSNSNSNSNDAFTKSNKRIHNLIFWRDRVGFIFDISISILLIMIFRPYQKKYYMNDEVRIILYLYGFILLFRANWSLFFKDSPTLHILQSFN